MNIKHFYTRMLLLIISGCIFNVVYAEKLPYRATKDELMLLPEFCQAKSALTRNTAQGKALTKRYSQMFKEAWTHMHHHCDGLNFRNRARRDRDKFEREHNLGKAAGSFVYMISHVNKDHFFTPGFYFELAKTQVMQKKQKDAIINFEKSIELKPDYVKAYKAYANLLVSLNDKEKAIQLLEKGIKNAPKSKSLKRKLKRLQEK